MPDSCVASAAVRHLCKSIRCNLTMEDIFLLPMGKNGVLLCEAPALRSSDRNMHAFCFPVTPAANSQSRGDRARQACQDRQ